MAYEPSISLFYDDPAPRAEVFFSAFAPGTATVTVYRESQGRTYQVRGGVRAVTAGTLSRIDHEIPFGIPVKYWAEMFDAAGLSLGSTGTVSTRMLVDETWLHNPLDPQGAARVTVLMGSGKSISRPSPGSVVYPQGRRVGVVIAAPRRGVAGLTFDVFSEDIETADRIQALLGDYSNNAVPVVCIRLGMRDNMRVPKPLFLGVLDIVEEEVDVHRGGEAVVNRMQGDEVDPPLPGLFVPTLRNADLKAYYATNAAMKSDNATNGDLLRRYDLAGMASAV